MYVKWFILCPPNHQAGLTIKYIAMMRKPVPDNWMTRQVLLMPETNAIITRMCIVYAKPFWYKETRCAYKWLWAAFNPY